MMTSEPTTGRPLPSQATTACKDKRSSSRSMSPVEDATAKASIGRVAASPGRDIADRGRGGKLVSSRSGGVAGEQGRTTSPLLSALPPLEHSCALWPVRPQEAHFTGSLHSAAKCPTDKHRKHLPRMLTKILPLLWMCCEGRLVVGRIEEDGALTLCLRRQSLGLTVVHPSSSSEITSRLEQCASEAAGGWAASPLEVGIECPSIALTGWEPVAARGAAVNADRRQDLRFCAFPVLGEEGRPWVGGIDKLNRTFLIDPELPRTAAA